MAEAKAQLLLTVNGILISVLFSTLFGKITEIRAFVDTFGLETWRFLFITIAALSGAVACSAQSLWSRHKRRVRLGLHPPAGRSGRASLVPSEGAVVLR